MLSLYLYVMELNFKNILLESIIDDLETLTKTDKAVLKFIHMASEKKTFNHRIGKTTYELDASDGLLINDLINTFGLNDYDYIFKMWNFYKKFGNVLFDEEVFDDFSYSKEDYDDVTKFIVAKYYVDNIVGREIYPGWTIELMEDPISMVEEDLMTLFVTNGRGEHIFLHLFELTGKELRGDLLTHNEETLGKYFSDELKISKHQDLISNFGVPNPIRELLNNLSDESLEKYFDFIIEQVRDEIEQWDEDILYFHNNHPEREG
jgi:hypothetical protein